MLPSGTLVIIGYSQWFILLVLNLEQGREPPVATEVEATKHDLLYSNGRLLYMESLPSAIRVNLISPKTVFSSPAHAWDKHWRTYFLRATRQDDSLKFSRHLDLTDGTRRTTYWYGYTRGLREWRSCQGRSKLLCIVSAGSLALWRKWEAHRLERKYAAADDEGKEEYFVPLSESQSSLLIIILLFVCLFACLIVCFSDMCYSCFFAQNFHSNLRGKENPCAAYAMHPTNGKCRQCRQ